MDFLFHSGWPVPVLIMLPNLIWMLAPKSGSADSSRVPQSLTVFENVGRWAVLILPFFYTLDWGRRFSLPVMGVMALALVLYYIAWGRYFLGGRQVALLGKPLLGIPQPMAVTPVIFLLLSAYLLESWPMLIASVLFGAAHIWVTSLSL